MGEATAWLLGAADRVDDWLAAATPYLDLAGLAIAGGLLARQALWARRHYQAEEADALVGRFRFFAIERLSAAPGLLTPVTVGGARLSGSFLT